MSLLASNSYSFETSNDTFLNKPQEELDIARYVENPYPLYFELPNQTELNLANTTPPATPNNLNQTSPSLATIRVYMIRNMNSSNFDHNEVCAKWDNCLSLIVN